MLSPNPEKMQRVRESVNDCLGKYDPFAIVCGTIATLAGVWAAGKVLSDPKGFKKRVVGAVFGALKAVPGVSGQIDKEREKMVAKLAHGLAIEGDNHKFTEIPDAGVAEAELLEVLRAFVQKERVGWSSGKVSGKVYNGTDEVTKLINTVYGLYSVSNSLHPDVFPSVRKFEAEIIRMTATMLHGDSSVVGATTAGGTESILMAVKTYREAGRARGIEVPEMFVQHSNNNGGHYFGVKIVRVDDGPDYRANVANFAKAINSNTIAVVGSAPSYPHGTIDDITAIAKLAVEKKIYCHVDGCLGGFVLPWIKMAGFDLPPFDFAVEGVTSMSCDTHKYGYGPKGLSVILFKGKELRKHMFFVTTEWPGGIYASPGVAGSRPGAPIAATWAVMVTLGKAGYVDAAKGIMECQKKIKEGMKDIPDMQLVGDSFSTVLGFTSKTVDAFMVADAMKKHGWVLDMLQRPNGFHICLTVRHIGVAETFLADLKAAVAEARDNPAAFKHGMAPVYGMAAELPDRSIISDFVTGYLDACLDTL